jgi:hypothetical protein
LYACWWAAGNTLSVVVWKIVPSFLLCCLWKKMNDRSFENCERTLEEIKFLFFNTLYLWITVFVSLLVIVIMIFLFFLLLLVRWLLLYISCVSWGG